MSILSSFAQSWSAAWSDSLFRKKFIAIWIFLIPLLIAFPVFFQHIEKREGVVLHDWLLQRLEVKNVSLPVFILIWGATLLGLVRGLMTPRLLLWMLWTYLFVSASRIFCIWLVPLNPPPHLIPLVDPLTNFFYGKSYITKDLFFSGHTSSLVLVAVCLEKKWDKILVGAGAVCLGTLLLVQHVHYTIDVLTAFPATWVCAQLGRKVSRTGL